MFEVSQAFGWVSGEVRAGDRAVGVPGMRGHMLISGCPTKLSLLSGAALAELELRASRLGIRAS